MLWPPATRVSPHRRQPVYPQVSLVWLARHLQARGAGIDAGDIVATGTGGCLVQMNPGHRVTAAWGETIQTDVVLL